MFNIHREPLLISARATFDSRAAVWAGLIHAIFLNYSKLKFMNIFSYSVDQLYVNDGRCVELCKSFHGTSLKICGLVEETAQLLLAEKKYDGKEL